MVINIRDSSENTGLDSFNLSISPTGYEGERCQNDVDECSFNPPICENDGTCNNLNGSFECFCGIGFIGNVCHSVDPCNSTNYCLNDGNCTSQANDEYRNVTVVCGCLENWYGPICEFTVSEKP